MTRTSLFTLGWSLCSAFMGLGCEPEVGMPCSDNPSYVNSVMQAEPDRIDLVRDVNFENCTQLLCMSVDESRPYCTRSCETDLECGADGFVCQRAVHFGPLACLGDDPERSCVESDGSPSPQPISYCVAPRSVIEARDAELGRSWP